MKASVSPGNGQDEMKATIIVAKEKHDTHYLDASSRDAFLVSCLETVQRRVNEGVFYHMEEGDVEKPDIEKEVVEGLPDGSTKTRLMADWRKYHECLEHVRKENDSVKMALLADKASDPYLAWHVLESRKGHEYEGFVINEMSASLGIQHIKPRPRMKPSFSMVVAEKALVERLEVMNAANLERASRKFKNVSGEEFVLGDILFIPGSAEVVPPRSFKQAKSDGRLEAVPVDRAALGLWKIDSICCLDAEDMVFAYWREGEKGIDIRPFIGHVYRDNNIHCINITDLVRIHGLTSAEWAKMRLPQD